MNKKIFSLTILLSFLVFHLQSFASSPDGYTFVSPCVDAHYVEPGSGVLLRPVKRPVLSVPDASLFDVEGTRSGFHTGTVTLGGGGVTVYFKPDIPFDYDESVTVRFMGDPSQNLEPFEYSFHTKKWISPQQIEAAQRAMDAEDEGPTFSQVVTPPHTTIPADSFKIVSDYDLPTDFPTYYYHRTANAMPGNTFLAFNGDRYSVFFNMVLDDSGKVINYYRTHERDEWFAPIDSLNLITWFRIYDHDFLVMDTTWTELRRASMINGYKNQTSFHDFSFFPDSSVIVMGLEYANLIFKNRGANVDDVVVIGGIFQVLDKDNNLLFQWRSLEDPGVRIDWANSSVNLGGTNIDYFHMNKVTLDTDGNYLLSSRHTDAIYKVSSDSARVMWVLGGKGNQYTFTDTTMRAFSGQHDVQRLENGHIIFFDNGSFNWPTYGQAIEYDLDETNRIATIAWKFDYNKALRSYAKGGVQRLVNGNTLATWGARTPGNFHLIEVDPGGNVDGLLQLKEGLPFRYQYDTYRGYRSNLTIRSAVPQLTWDEAAPRPRILVAKFGDPDVAGYELNFSESTTSATWDTTIEATSLYLDNLEPGSWKVTSRAVYADQPASGTSDTLSFTLQVNSDPNEPPIGIPNTFALVAYPNPFNSTVRITVNNTDGNVADVKIFNELGRLVADVPVDFSRPGMQTLSVNMDHFASGPYFVRARLHDGSVFSRRIVLLH